MLHHANNAEGILEFIKGDLRLFCFEDSDDRLIVLTSGTIKKRKKADKSEVDRAVRVKREYLAAKQQGRIKLVSLDDRKVKEIDDGWYLNRS